MQGVYSACGQILVSESPFLAEGAAAEPAMPIPRGCAFLPTRGPQEDWRCYRLVYRGGLSFGRNGRHPWFTVFCGRIARPERACRVCPSVLARVRKVSLVSLKALQTSGDKKTKSLYNQ